MYKCFKCKKEIKQAVRLECEDYCYHCADIKQREITLLQRKEKLK